MKKFKKALLFILISTIVGFGIGFGVSYGMAEDKSDIVSFFSDALTLALTAVGFLTGIVLSFSLKPKKKKKSKNTGETASGEKFDIAFDSSFMTPEKLKSAKELVNTTWTQLPSLNNTGFVFRNKMVNGRYEIGMKPETHALVIGTTGTGKTQILANPTVRILAHTAEKPTLVMTDPKGELYADNANILKKEGYEIVVLNLEDPYVSSKWNPLEPAFDTYQRAQNLASEVKKYSNCTPESVGFQKFSANELNGIEYGDSWFGFEGKAFPNNDILKKELENRKLQLEDEAKADLRNIAISILPVPPDSKDPSWFTGAQDFILGILQAMLEDSKDPRLGMTREKFNFFNLYKIAMWRDSGDNQLATLSRYSEGRDPIKSNVHNLMNAVCGAGGVTQRSFLSTLASSIGKTLGDDGILYMTSSTDVDFKKFVEKPTAFFLRIPDHKTERHPLATICVAQLYKILVDLANSTINPQTGKTGTLKRTVYFILDEFGNMPAFQNFGTMVTVSRSRKIFFEIILQSYKQLDIKYGAEEAQNIRGNFQMEVFLGSEDPSTIQAFSEACGEITVFHEEESESKAEKGEQGKTVNKSTQRTRRPLIDKAELRTLEKWTVIAKLFGQPIVKEVMSPFYSTSIFTKDPATPPVGLAKSLDAEKIYYDIEKRNELYVKPKPRNPFGF